MPRSSKSASKSPSKAKPVRATKNSSKNQFIDDEAVDSDDAVIVDEEDKEQFTMVATPSDVEFIDDSSIGQVDKDASRKKGSPKKKGKAIREGTKSEDVIDVAGSSSEEDLAAMDPDDSMFRKPVGVKSTALPRPITTRSSAKRGSDGVIHSSPVSVKKKAKFSSDLESDDREQGQMEPPFPMKGRKMDKFMSAWKAYMESDAEDPSGIIQSAVHPKKKPASKPLKREKTDAVEEQASGSKISSDSLGKSRTFSPDWEPPFGILDQSVTGVGNSVGVPRRLRREQPDDGEAPLAQLSQSKPGRYLSSSDKLGKGIHVISAARRSGKGAMEEEFPFSQHAASDSIKTVARPSSDDRVDGGSDDGSEAEPVSTVFLEDLETYKTYFDSRAPCGVADQDLQDPALARQYQGLHPLPGGRQILPSFDPQGRSSEEYPHVKGGRVKFSSWKKHLRLMLIENSNGALAFKEAEPNFINPSRVSPLRLARQSTPGTSGANRLLVGSRIAVCVSAVFCSESFVMEPTKIGPRSIRTRKWVSGIFHNQEWERFESIMCLVFAEDVMYSQISGQKAISFQTMISPDPGNASTDVDTRFQREAPSDMFSAVVSKTSPKKASPAKAPFQSKTLLNYNEIVPVYDARKIVIDFQSDLGRLEDVLPRYVGEIPFSSFIVVGYTASSFVSTRGGSEKVSQLGCNILWVIVCGTPSLKK